MSAGRPCTICSHTQHRAIDAALASGASVRVVARDFHLSTQAVTRHRETHLAQRIAAAQREEIAERDEAVAEARHGSDLLAQARDLQAKALGFMAVAYREGDVRASLAAVRECTRLLELQGKLLHQIDAPATTINIIASVEFRQVQAVILTALESHPDAKVAVLRALEAVT